LNLPRIEDLPHKYPFIFIDKVLEKHEKSIVTLKNVSYNEPHFAGHFPECPVMPGVLILEGMFQSGGLICIGCKLEPGKAAFMSTIDKVKFRKPVFPGDQIKFDVNLVAKLNTVMKFTGKASVDGTVVAEATWVSLIVNTKE
tara:strand:+ start:1836 stop:2261 length:426 start_codon:yes stop_codon:yes gene_type:complete